MANKDGKFIKDLPDANALDGSEFIPGWQNNRTTKFTPLDIQTFVNGGTGCTMLCAQLTLTSAEFLDINTTPQLIVAAPGANKVILPDQVHFLMRYDTTTYVDNGDLVVYADSDGSGTLISGSVTHSLSGSVYNNTADSFTSFTPQNDISGVNQQLIVNRGMYLSLDGSDPTVGDSEISIFMTYRILDLADVAS